MLRHLISVSAVQFWRAAEFDNVANPYFEDLNHLQNPGHFLLTKGCIITTFYYTTLQ